jgi:hypothetical protein
MRACFAAKINLRKANHGIASACGLSSLGPRLKSLTHPRSPQRNPSCQTRLEAWIPRHPETQRHHRSARPSLSLPGRRTHDDHPSARANSPNAANHAARRSARLSPRPRPRPGGMGWRGVAWRGKDGRVSNTQSPQYPQPPTPAAAAAASSQSGPASQPARVAVAAAVGLHVMAWPEAAARV